MKNNTNKRLGAVLPGIVSTLLLGSMAVSAADAKWVGSPFGGTPPLWSDAANWEAGTVPIGGDNLIFADYGSQMNTNDLTGLSFGWMRFDNGDWYLAGNALTLASGVTNISGNNSLAMPVTLGGAQTWDLANGSTLTNAANLALGTYALKLAGDGNTALGATAANVVSGSGSVTKYGYGTLYWNAANNTLTGGIVVNGGTLVAFSGNWTTTFFGNVTPRNITLNAGGMLETTTHSLGGLGAAFYAPTIYMNGGTWQLDREQYLPLGNLIFTVVSSLTGDGELRSQGGTLAISNNASGSTMACGLSMVTGGTIEVADGAAIDDFTLSGYLSGSGANTLTKTGAGRLALGGATTGYSANLPINAGTLAISAVSLLERVPTITVASNATFDVSAASGYALSTNQTLTGVGSVIGTINDNNPGAVGAAISPGGSGLGTLTIDGLRLSGSGLVLNYNLGTTTTVGGAVNDLITVTNLYLDGPGTNIVNFTFSGTPAAGAYTLITYPAGQGPAAGPITTLAAAASRSIYTFSSDGSSIKVTVVPNPAALVWRGDGISNNWDLVTSSNWMKGGVKDLFYTGDNATFDNTGSNTPAINLVGALSANIVTFTGTKDYTLGGTGKLSGSSRLIKTNSGTLTVLTANDNAGGGLLSGGAVNVGNGPAVGNLGTGNLTNNTRVNFTQSASSTYGGNMSGTGSVYAFVPGATLTFSGTNSFTGGLTLQNGTFQIGGNPTVAGCDFAGSITNYGILYYSRTDAFTNRNFVTSDGNTYQFAMGEVNIRGNGGMTIDGTAPISTLGNLNISQGLYGKLTVNSGGLVNVGAVMLMGNPGSIGSDLIQNGGTINVSNHVRIAHWGNTATTMSTYTMNGGLLNVPNAQVAVGWDGIGFMNMNGGLVNCVRLTIDDNGITGGFGITTNSTFKMTGGQLNIGFGGITSVSTTNQFAPTVQFSGGTILATAPTGFSSSLHMWLTNGTPTFDSSNSLITLSGVLKGNGGLTKTGAGILQLDGVNVYTNTTTIAAGRLQGGGSINGPLVVQSGAVLSAGGTLARGTLTVSNNVTVSPGASLLIDQASTALSSDYVRVYGNLTLDAATPLNINFTGGLPYTGGANVILTNSGTRTGSLTYVNPTRYSVVLDQSNPNYITTSFSGTNATLVWKGNVNNLWNVNTATNWLLGAAPATYYQSDAVIFDNTGIATPNISLTAPMAPASVVVNAGGNYKFSGSPITGVTTLTKGGAGKLTLENDYTSTGVINVNAGTFQIGDGGTTGSITGIGSNAGANLVDLGSVVFNRSDSAFYNGVISGSGTVTQAGAGKLTLVGANSFFGGATVNPGTSVQIGNGAAIDNGIFGTGLVQNNGTLTYFRSSQITIAAPHTGAGALNFLGTGISGQSSYQMNGTNSFTGPVTLSMSRLYSPIGALGFGNPVSINVPSGSGVFVNAVTYSTLVNVPLTLAGVGWNESSGFLGALRVQNGTTWAGPITLAGNTRISAHTDGNSNVISGTITGPFELEFGSNASGFLSLAPSAPNSFSALRMSAGTVWLANGNALPSTIPLFMNGGTLKLNGMNRTFTNFQSPGGGSIQNGSTISPANVTIITPPSGAITYAGTFLDGASKPLNVTITQSGVGSTFTLNADNTAWTGNFTNNNGTLVVASSSGRLGPAGLASRTLVFNDCTFNLSPNNAWSGGGAQATMILNNSILNCTRYNSFGPFVLNGSTLTGSVTGSDSAYYALYNLTGGRVTVVGTKPSLMSGTSNTGAHGFNLQTPTIFDVADVTGSVAEDLTVTAPLRTGGAIGGAGALVKAGSGKMLVTDVATYTGYTVVSNGVLALSGAGSLATSSSFTINSGATLDASAIGTFQLAGQTLKGSGTVLGTVSDGATSVIAPGSSVGTLTVGGLTLNGSGGRLDFELNSTSTTVGGSVNDLIQINGNLTLNDAQPTPVNFTFLNGPNAAGTYTIMKYTGTLNGTAAGLVNNQGYPVTFTVGGGFVRATFTAAPAQSLVWQGDGAGNIWDTTLTSVNWSNTTAQVLTNFYPMDSVRFDDSSINTTIDVAANVNPSSMTFDSMSDYTLQGAGKITGVTTITKNNTNTVKIGVVNSAVGPVNVNAGILKFNGDVDDSYDGMTTITVANGAAFDFGGSFDTVQTTPHNFVVSGSGPDGLGAIRDTLYPVYSYTFISNLTMTSDTVFGGEQRWDIGPMLGSTINGQGYKLTKVGAFDFGMRVQTITNLASITVSNGNMWYENWDQTNSWTSTTTNYIKPGAFLGNYASRTINLPISLESATLRAEGANGVPTWTGPIQLAGTNLFNNATVQNIYGVVSGSGAIGVNGGRSSQIFTNANSYTGGTIVSNGPSTTLTNSAAGTATLIASHASALGTGPLTIDGSAFSSLATNTAFFGTNILRPVEFNVTGGAVVPTPIVLPGVGPITNVAIQGRDASSAFTLGGKISGGFIGLTNWFDNGTGNVGATRLLNPANDFVSSRIFVNRGTLALAANNVLGNLANPLVPNANSTIRFDGPTLTLANPLFAAYNPVYLDTFGDNNGDGIPETANTATISGLITGGGTIFPRGTNGTLILSGANTFSGGFELQQPVTLQVAASTNLGTAYVAIKYGSTFRYTGTGAETMTRTLWMDSNNGGTIDIPSATASLTWNPGGGTFNQPMTKTGSGALTIGTIGIGGGILTANGGALTINSVISGAAVVIVNTGTVTLNGNNTYAGPTLANAGTLIVNGTIPAANGVIVAPTALMAGNGTINCPVNVSGALQPGVNAIGKLTVNNMVGLSGTTTMELNKATGTNDTIVGATSITYGGTLTVVNLGGTLAAGDTFKLFGAWAYSGTFTSTNLPALSAGLAWDTSGLLADGTIKVVSSAPPALTGASLLGNGNVQITLSGTTGQGYKILGSADVSLPVASWTVLQSGTLPSALFNWEDLDTKNNPTRFYIITTP